MTVVLPAWATWSDHPHASPDTPGSPKVDAHADQFYPAILAEYRSLYPKGCPRPNFIAPRADMITADMSQDERTAVMDDLWASMVADLHDSKVPSEYWLEVAYQTMKMDLVFAFRSHALTIHVQDKTKSHAMETAPEAAHGHKVREAAGGLKGGKEARGHITRLRGSIPNFS